MICMSSNLDCFLAFALPLLVITCLHGIDGLTTGHVADRKYGKWAWQIRAPSLL